MTASEYEDSISPNLVREVFEPFVIEPGKSRWAIFVSGRLISVGGKAFYDSRQQAVKAFYNSFHWRAMYKIQETLHPNEESYRWWTSEDRTPMWNGFKKALEKKYGFSIREV